MIAALPMYDLPELRTATDRWWAGLAAALRRAGFAAPAVLTRSPDVPGLWRHPGLLLSQSCGYPITHQFAAILQVVATPVYAAAGCEGTDYRSVLVVHTDSRARRLADLRGGICAVNARDSHSGYNGLRAAVAPLAAGRPFFRHVVVSGAHSRSLALVAAGQADLCAVDCVTHALLSRHRPAALASTRVLGYTARAPGLPFVTRRALGPEEVAGLRRALFSALADPALADARAALLLAGAEVLPEGRYRRILAMERAARRAGYPELC